MRYLIEAQLAYTVACSKKPKKHEDGHEYRSDWEAIVQADSYEDASKYFFVAAVARLRSEIEGVFDQFQSHQLRVDFLMVGADSAEDFEYVNDDLATLPSPEEAVSRVQIIAVSHWWDEDVDIQYYRRAGITVKPGHCPHVPEGATTLESSVLPGAYVPTKDKEAHYASL